MLKRRYLFVFSSGILFSVPFIFPEFNILSFFSGIPFFMILFDDIINNKNNTNNKIFKYTFVFGMSFYLPVYIWFLWMYPMEQTGVTPLQSACIVVAAWFGFPLMQTFVLLMLPFGLRICKKLYIKNIFVLPLTAACFYVITEWAQSWFMSGLTWAKLSISQYKDLFFIQSVSLFGTYFASFVIIFINAAIALYILNKNNFLILSVILLYFMNSYFGYFRIMYYDYIEKTSERTKITAQIMQGNIPSYEKWEVAGYDNSMKVYESLLENYVDETVDICVFPETSVPVSITQNGRVYNRLLDLAKKYDITLFAGTFYVDGDKEYNANMAFDKNYDFIQPYGKRHLVPFGEYLPADKILRELIPFVSNMALFDSVLTPGEGSDIMTVNGINYGGLICFDSIFPELARISVKNGADILIVVTNDSWFRDSPAIYQHNAQAVLRAVENNRYVVRAANTGISTFISNTGKILQKSQILEREVLTEDIYVVKNKTIYTVCGDIILYLSFSYVAFCFGRRIKINKK